jgi:type VI secretion system secreted protein Hcp
MATDAFMKFDGVKGESVSKGHEGEVEVLSWQWGVSNGAHSMGGGSGQGKPEGMALSFTHHYDKASPVLQKKCVDGVHFDKVTLVARKSVGTGQEDFFKIVLEKAYITSVTHSGSDLGQIHENVSLSYDKIDFGYKPQKPDGKLDAEIPMGWNIKTGVTT